MRSGLLTVTIFSSLLLGAFDTAEDARAGVRYTLGGPPRGLIDLDFPGPPTVSLFDGAILEWEKNDLPPAWTTATPVHRRGLPTFTGWKMPGRFPDGSSECHAFPFHTARCVGISREFVAAREVVQMGRRIAAYPRLASALYGESSVWLIEALPEPERSPDHFGEPWVAADPPTHGEIVSRTLEMAWLRFGSLDLWGSMILSLPETR